MGQLFQVEIDNSESKTPEGVLASVKSRVTSVLKIAGDFMQSKEVVAEQISKLERERRLKNERDLEEL
jgi:hypothetical protein